MIKKIIPGIVILIIIALVIIISNNKETAEYKIGVILSLTERGATYGNRALNGIKLAIDELNKDEFFKDNQINLYVEDSKSSATEAVTAFNKLININNIPVAIGFVLSDEVLACAPVANSKKVILLTTAAGSDKIKDAGDYVFRNRESGDIQVEELVKTAIQKMGYKEFSILYSNSANGVSYKNAFEKIAKNLGGKIVETIGYNENKSDYRSEIGRLKRIKAKAIYIAGLDTELGLILKQSKELGLSAQFFASAGAISEKLLEIAGSSAEGLVCSSAAFDTSSTDEKVKTFVEEYSSKYNEAPDFISANSYDAVFIIAELFMKEIVTGELIKNELYKIKNFSGVGGTTTFDEFGEVYKPGRLLKIHNRSFIQFNQ